MLTVDSLWRVRHRLAQIGKKRTGSPRILVVGVCQAGSMAKVLRYLLPDAQVDFVSAFTANRRFPKLVDLMAHADGYDHVYSSIYLPRFKDGGTIDRSGPTRRSG